MLGRRFKYALDMNSHGDCMTRYVALGEQSEFGTPTTPTHYIRVTSVEINPEAGNIYPELADSRFDAPAIGGAFKVSGSFECPVELEHIGYPIKYALGSVTSYTIDDTAGVYEHIFTPIDFGSSLPAFTMAVGKDNVTEETVGGCVINSMSLETASKELLVATFEYGGVLVKLTSLTTPSFPSPDFIAYHRGVVKIAGEERADIEAITITVENNVNFDDAYRITRTKGRLPKEFPVGGCKITVEFDARFRDTKYYNYFLGGASATELQDEPYSVEVEVNFIGKTLDLSSGTTHQYLVIKMPKVIIDSISVPMSGRDRLVATVSATAGKGTVTVERYDGTTVTLNTPIAIYLRNKVSSY